MFLGVIWDSEKGRALLILRQREHDKGLKAEAQSKISRICTNEIDITLLKKMKKGVWHSG